MCAESDHKRGSNSWLSLQRRTSGVRLHRVSSNTREKHGNAVVTEQLQGSIHCCEVAATFAHQLTVAPSAPFCRDGAAVAGVDVKGMKGFEPPAVAKRRSCPSSGRVPVCAAALMSLLMAVI